MGFNTMAKSKNNNRKNVVATTLNRLIVIFKRTAMVALSALGNFLYTTIKDGKVLSFDERLLRSL